MYLKRLAHSMLVRCVKLPGARTVCQSLYRAFCSKKSLDLDGSEPSKALPPRPKGAAFWSKDERPVWVDDCFDLSVIIPFYKTEQYAVECIRSVLSQDTSFRYETILIDDGSPDGCPAILDSYRDRPNTQVIHQSNSGVSAARNRGIRASRGRYILFFDSDDILCPGAIEALMSAAIGDRADIVEGSFRTMTKKGIVKRRYRREAKLGSRGEGMSGYVGGKVYRKELFAKVCFPEGYWFEDTIIASLLFPMASVTKTIEQDVFLYRTNPTGATFGSAADPKSIDSLYVTEAVIEACDELGLDIPKRSMLWQLGPYLYGRIHTLPKRDIQTAFLMAADAVERYALATDRQGGTFYERELCEAFIHRRYHRWKWASILM